MIKYLGSKRRLVPVLGAMASAVGARSAVDVFTGTTRVAQELKRRGLHVDTVDTARYSEVFARCYVATDARRVDPGIVAAEIDRLNALPPQPGYVTDVFCRRSRYFRPENGARIDAIRDAIAADHAGTWLEPLLLTSLVEAADRVDSTTGLQMAYLKQWSARSARPLVLRPPELLPGPGGAHRGDATALAAALPRVDFAYLDPPYNQHSFHANYHVWETLVAWDAPEHYGVACKRVDCRDPATKSAFNRRAEMPGALTRVIVDLDTPLMAVSCNDEGWLSADDLVEMSRGRGAVRVLSFASRRYVGARIGVHNRRGERVGTVGRLSNVEHLVLSGDPVAVRRAAHAAVTQQPAA